MAKNMETGIMWCFMKCVDFSPYLHAARGNEGAQKEMETTVGDYVEATIRIYFSTSEKVKTDRKFQT